MEKYNYTAKTEEAAKEQALYELKLNDNDIIYTKKEVKAGLFGKKIEIEVVKKDDIYKLIRENLERITNKMGIDTKIEIKTKEYTPVIVIYSEDNSILIGKQGKNLNALTTIIRQIVNREVGQSFKFSLDVGEYKKRRERDIIRIAKQTAKEVAKTKIAASLDSMNSYERRIIHNALNNWKDVYTESEGKEPNRYVVIKPKEEK